MKRTTAPNSVGGLHVDKVPGVTIGTTGIAEDRNNLQEEIANAIEAAGITLSGANDEQLKEAIIALSHGVAEPVFTLVKKTTGILWPAVRVDDGDHDIASANYPDLVTALRAQKTESDGVTDHSGTVAGSVFTFPTNNAADRLLAALAEEVLVHGSYTSWLALNIGGTDYAITNVNAGARTVTVSGSPPTGAQTGIVYAYRIAGSSTTARLRRMSGRSLVGTEAETGDTPDRMLLAGLRVRDRGQGWQLGATADLSGARNLWARASTRDMTNSTQASANSAPIDIAIAIQGQTSMLKAMNDGTNGDPRIGKTTEPRSYPGYLYIWAGRYVA